MDSIIQQANSFLSIGSFEYSFCGGYALDLFLGKPTRRHSDIDICVYEKDKGAIFSYMKANKWKTYEFHGQGIVRRIDSIMDFRSGKNLMCLKEDCELVEFYSCEKGDDYFIHDFNYTGITSLNYLEFLFNEIDSNNLVFNSRIKRSVDKAILWRKDIPFLSPELVLLYKSGDTEREENQYDYRITVPHMDDEQISWFNSSLDILYPNGHEWKE